MTRAGYSLIRLADLAAKKKSSITSLRASLHRNGFAIISIDHLRYQKDIEDGLKEAVSLPGFRFPSIDPETATSPGPKATINDTTTTNSIYNDAKRRCFQTLLDIGVATFAALVHGTPVPISVQNAVHQYRHYGHRRGDCHYTNDKGTNNRKIELEEDDSFEKFNLFGMKFDSDEPFETPDNDPFGHSFFNLFSYDSGMLNSHMDRGLLTIIAVRVPTAATKEEQIIINTEEESNSNNDDCDNVYSNHISYSSSKRKTSALWVKKRKVASNNPSTKASILPSSASNDCNNNYDHTNDNLWQNIDKELLFTPPQGDEEEMSSSRVVVLLGEDIETLPVSLKYNLYAAEHSVRVDPTGAFISRSHYRSDPAAVPAPGASEEKRPHRQSAALILRTCMK